MRAWWAVAMGLVVACSGDGSGARVGDAGAPDGPLPPEAATDAGAGGKAVREAGADVDAAAKETGTPEASVEAGREASVDAAPDVSAEAGAGGAGSGGTTSTGGVMATGGSATGGANCGSLDPTCGCGTSPDRLPCEDPPADKKLVRGCTKTGQCTTFCPDGLLADFYLGCIPGNCEFYQDADHIACRGVCVACPTNCLSPYVCTPFGDCRCAP